MQFDIVIPTYERPDLLVETVESALAQTAEGVRVTVADNASGPGTAEAVGGFGDRVRYLRFDEHLPYQGSLTRAKGLIEAPHGMVLHDDDLLDDDYVETALETFGRHPDAGMVVTHVRPLADAGVTVPELASPFHWARVFGHSPTGTGPAGPEMLLAAGAFPATVARLPYASPYWPAVSLRTAAYHAAGPYDTELGMLTDVDMWLRVGAHQPLVLVDAVRCSYRFHRGSMTTEQDASRGDVFIRDVVRMYEKERAGDAGWSWSDDESVAWLSYALQRSGRAGRAAQRADFREFGLELSGASLEELRRHHVRARILRLRALRRHAPALRPIAEVWARLRLWLDAR